MSYPLHFPTNDAQTSLITLTYNDNIWTIEIHNGVDNRLTETLLSKALNPALDAVERDWRARWRAAKAVDFKEGSGVESARGALIIVGRKTQYKFFSNGLDFAKSGRDPNFFPHVFNPIMIRLLSFPIPVIAAMNGHTFAGGLVLALACDYRVMIDGKKRRAWACMNEVHFGAPWPQSIAGIIHAKIRDARVVRRIGLEGHRFTPSEALESGIIDAIADGGSTDDVLRKACEIAEGVMEVPKLGVWGLIKRDMYRDAILACLRDERTIMPEVDDAAARARL